jgi:hypothetical protein
MTLPFERKLAIKNTREFLKSLLDPKRTPKVPLSLRKQARSLLKHYPSDFDMLNPKKTFNDEQDYNAI